MSKYDINDASQQEKMLRHCPMRLCGSIHYRRLYIRAVEDYARYYTLSVQANEIEGGETSHRYNVLRNIAQHMYGESRGIMATLEVMTGSDDAWCVRPFPDSDIWQGIEEDGHELYVDQWQWGTFKAMED